MVRRGPRVAVTLGVDANTRISLTKSATNNTFSWVRASNPESVRVDGVIGAAVGASWFTVGLSYDIGDGLIAYLQGIQEGIKQPFAVPWAGALVDARTQIGSALPPFVLWNGWLSCVAVRFDTVWTPSDFLAMHNEIMDT